LRACVSAGVGGDTDAWGNLARRADWSKLLDLAERHAVMPLLAEGARRLGDDAVPAEARTTLADTARTQALFTLRMSAELLRIAEAFAAGGVDMLVVKGPALALQAYGDAAMRSYGDLDLLVRDRDIARATRLMLEAGFTAQIPLRAIAAGKIPGQYTFRRPEAGLLVELHNDKTMRYYPRPLALEAWFARQAGVRMDGRDIPAPSVEDHLILVCVHGAKHFWERLQWIADVAALIGRRGDERGGAGSSAAGAVEREVRWDLVTRSAEETGAETLLHSGLLLAARALRAKVPQDVLARAEADAAACAMTEQTVRWLPEAGEPAAGLLARAMFRMRMRGGGARGTGYFLRLLFSPTEEDWNAEDDEPQRLVDVMKRPFRLAKKHGGGKQ
jgi:putative nucleotidyltransferase-like protein